MNYEEENDMNEEERIIISPLNRMLKVFTSPTKVFKAIKENPNVLLPVLAIGIIVFLYYFAFMEQFREYYLQITEQNMAKTNSSLTPEILKSTVNISVYSSMIFIPIMSAGGIFLSALYYWLFVLVLKGEGNYKHYASMVAHVGLISLLQFVVMGVMIIITGVISIDAPVTSVASLLPESMKNGLLYYILMKVEVFNVWRLIVTIIGLKEISRLKNYKVYLIAGVAFLTGIIYTVISLYMAHAVI